MYSVCNVPASVRDIHSCYSLAYTLLELSHNVRRYIDRPRAIVITSHVAMRCDDAIVDWKALCPPTRYLSRRPRSTQNSIRDQTQAMLKRNSLNSKQLLKLLAESVSSTPSLKSVVVCDHAAPCETRCSRHCNVVCSCQEGWIVSQVNTDTHLHTCHVCVWNNKSFISALGSRQARGCFSKNCVAKCKLHSCTTWSQIKTRAAFGNRILINT